jgi:anti-sigma regulatory factor (Ser/Thr protein kinase)
MQDEKINLESDLINLAKARDFISRKAKEAGASETDITKIEISCDEWSANIIEHALGGDRFRMFSIECTLNQGRFCISFENEGERFNPIEQEDVDLNDHYSDSKERGLGIYIMKEMMDEIHYEYLLSGVNKLVLVKILFGDR